MDNGWCFQLIDGDGNFNESGIDNFIKEVALERYELSYVIVSIMGTQSSGKSTLLNHLFGTSFQEMNALTGRRRTTNGIWLARCIGIEPCTLVMDIEGADGSERGEDTSFQEKTGLFALAVSDVVLVNLWCKDFNRIQGSNLPLLKIIFEGILQLLMPRKMTLIFVLRDHKHTPLENLESQLRKYLQEIWDSIPKSETHRETVFDDFFNVHLNTLSTYEDNEEQFKVEVASMRRLFSNSIAHDGLVGDQRRAVPANAFARNARQIWQFIENQRAPSLPNLQVLVSSFRCDNIVFHKSSRFMVCEDWLQLKEAAESGSIIGFGKSLSSILQTFLLQYDEESKNYDDDVKSSKRKCLQENILLNVKQTFKKLLQNIKSGVFENFKDLFDKALNSGERFASSAQYYLQSSMSEFDKKCEEIVIEEANWETSTTREKIMFDICAYIDSARAASLPKLTTLYESKLKEALSRPVNTLLNMADDGTWPSIKNLLTREVKLAEDELSKALSDVEVNEETQNKMVSDLKKYATGVVEEEAKKKSAEVLTYMINRFTRTFNYDADSFPRLWTKKEDIRKITKMARLASLKVLSVMAIIRLDNDVNNDVNNVERILSAALIRSVKVESLYSATWKQVAPSKTLINPVECKSIWSTFKNDTQHLVQAAISKQKAIPRTKYCWSSPWLKNGLKISFCIAVCFALYLLLKGILDIFTKAKNIF